jgi:uncharacterized membrane protein YccC
MALGPVQMQSFLTPHPFRFALATTTAAFLALAIAFWLELESPYWAATTVMIVAQPVPGQVVGKGFYRGLGTITGAVAATVLMALFAQTPELFIAGMALWLAGCTYVSTLLRGFRSYGAVLSGYTAAIVAFGAPAPTNIFDIAVARASAILVGIVCGAALSALLLPGTARTEVLQRLRDTIASALDLLDDVVEGRSGRETRRRIAREIAAIENLTDAAQAEALEFRHRIGNVGAALAELLSILSALRSVEEHLRRLDPERREAQLARISAYLAVWSGWLDELRRSLLHLGGVAVLPAPASDLPQAEMDEAGAASWEILRERIEDALRALERAVEAYAAIAGLKGSSRRARLFHHRDPAQARRNALRALIAVCLAGAFWIASAWPLGATFVANVGIICSLFATQDRPSAAGIFFMKGMAIALPLSFAWRFLVLPWGEGFGFLALALAPPVFLGGLAFVHPRTARVATSFNVYFLSLVAPTNVMTYDPASFLDNAVATVFGVVTGVMVFSLVLPTDPRRVARRILDRIRRDIAAVAMDGSADRQGLESLIYDRVSRIFALSGDEKLLADGVAALSVALEVARLRAKPLPGAARVAIEDALMRLASALRAGPAAGLDEALSGAMGSLAALRPDADPDERRMLLQAEAALGMIFDVLGEHPTLFNTPQEAIA